MAVLKISREVRGQMAAIAKIRWQLFVNSLGSIHGRLELVSHGFIGLGFAIAGLGGALGLGTAAAFFVSSDRADWLTLLLWPVFMFWQLFPVMATAFTENFDSSNLLRFPLSYSSFFMIRLANGSLDPATALGSLWLAGMAMGIGYARLHLLPWAVMVLVIFAGLNILIGRVIFAWIERWLARRRTREILGVIFLLIIISFQFIGPLVNRFGEGPRPVVGHAVSQILSLQRLLPPGLAAAAIARASHSDLAPAFGAFLLLAGYGIAVAWLLHLRLRAQYRGENLSEAVARSASTKEKSAIRQGWNLPGFSSPVAAIFEKEFRYLSRSGPMLFTMIMPVLVLLIFRLTPSRSGDANGFLVRAPDLAFPAGAAYALLVLTNLMYNNFGADASGIQFFFAAPVRFREILLAKNLAHAGVMALETVLVWLAVCIVFRRPSLDVTLTTVAGLLFVLLVNLAVGNLLSLCAPKKIDFGTFGRQRGSNTTVFASFAVQIAVFGLAAFTLLTARRHGAIRLATLIFLALAAIAAAGYALALSRADQMALARRETLIAELSRA
jgi:ABC-2 type transport system permease protein